MFFLGSVIPHSSFSIAGNPVTYAEWWRSGIGAFASLVGFLMPVSGWLMLRKIRFSRAIYLAALALPLVGPYLFWQQYKEAMFNMFFMLLIGLYLYLRAPVVEYFGSNNSFKPNPLRGSA